jgi:hypothetical protein
MYTYQKRVTIAEDFLYVYLVFNHSHHHYHHYQYYRRGSRQRCSSELQRKFDCLIAYTCILQDLYMSWCILSICRYIHISRWLVFMSMRIFYVRLFMYIWDIYVYEDVYIWCTFHHGWNANRTAHFDM